MNIAFWSNVKHQSGVTSSVVLLSALWVELFVEEVAVTSNHFCSGGLEKRLYGGFDYEEKAARRAYSYMIGEPEYFRMLYSGKIQTALWLNDSLRFVPMEGESEELFAIEGLNSINRTMQKNEYVMIDTACGFGLSSQKILDEAEVTVIVFPPRRECVDAFFQSETKLQRNSFFILGNYRAEASCRPSYLTRKYSIPKERIGVIPYNLGFEQAMRDGSTIAYITRNMNCSKRNNSYRFIQYATKTVESLREYVINRRKELCGDCEKV